MRRLGLSVLALLALGAAAQAQGIYPGDAVRVNGNALRAKVVAEGGNLGLTQRARVEFALNGGRINTDFIDNSAGVDSSDREVNIKILLSDAIRRKSLAPGRRNALLRAARNLAVSELRARGRRPVVSGNEAPEPLDPGPSADEALADAEERGALRTAVRDGLDELTETEREALEQRYRSGMTYREMAERSGTAISTLQARVQAGLEKLRRRIGNPERGA